MKIWQAALLVLMAGAALPPVARAATTAAASTAPAPTAASSTASPETGSACPSLTTLRPDILHSHWVKACVIDWPADDGFAAAPVLEQLQVGTLIDRFGSPYGRFFSPEGASYGARAVPYSCMKMVYTVFRVLVPLPVRAGQAAPWFDEPGGATQFETDASAGQLVTYGELAVVRTDVVGADDADGRCQN